MRHSFRSLTMMLLLLFLSQPLVIAAVEELPTRVKESGVTVTYKKEGRIQYVVGKIRVPHSPDKVWPVLANPFEFEEKITPKFKTVRVLKDQPGIAVLECRVDFGFLMPTIKYTVESIYENGRRITFRSRAGDLKDFRGTWEVLPINGGKETEVVYSMYVEPGIPIPQWFIRQGLKFELPRTLNGLRTRIGQIYRGEDAPVRRRIAAAGNITVF
jgi:hypothetical protein